MQRIIRTALVVLTSICLLLAYAPASVADEKKTHEGTVVSAGNGKLVMTGTDGKEHSHDIGPDVVVTVNGKMGTLESLTKGMHIRVMTDAAGTVVAVSTVDDTKGAFRR